MEVSPKTLREVEFREKRLGGYHPDDVDEFLERVAVGIEVYQEKLRQAGEERTALLAATAHGGFLLRSRSDIHWDGSADLSERQRALDVVKLHKLVLAETLGLSEDDIRDQKHLRYVRDARDAADQVTQGVNVAFLMNPARMEQVRDIAFGGEVLPQKSTDFYPKLLSGLVAYSLQEAAQPSAVGGHQVASV